MIINIKKETLDMKRNHWYVVKSHIIQLVILC